PLDAHPFYHIERLAQSFLSAGASRAGRLSPTPLPPTSAGDEREPAEARRLPERSLPPPRSTAAAGPNGRRSSDRRPATRAVPSKRRREAGRRDRAVRRSAGAGAARAARR